MNTRRICRARTAIGRTDLSRPVRLALESSLITCDTTVFDYGCGRGDDLRLLGQLGVDVAGWDPEHRPDVSVRPADVVNLGYVINVIEDAQERTLALRRAWELAARVLIVAARLNTDATGRCDPFGDGVVSGRDTFQKYFTQKELRDWIEQTLDCDAVAASPGVFFLFRNDNERQDYLERRCRRLRTAPKVRKSDVLFERHRELLQPLIAFITRTGRLPAEWELEQTEAISAVFGSVRRAFSVIRRVTGSNQWDRIRVERYQELLNYLALEKFGGRPRFSELARGLQLDIREYFSSYRAACEHADRLLFAAGNLDSINQAALAAAVGKLTPTALYVHSTALRALPVLLQVYEGCARRYIGVVEGANIIKLYRHEPGVSYLAYPDFECDPHPALLGAMHIGLRTLSVRYRDYSLSDSPPVLHRKEAFVSPEHPLRPKFERLTKQEERWGVLRDTRTIGTRRSWERRLEAEGLRLRGHRLVRKR